MITISKMFLNQRYVYKIDASYLAKHKWNINLKDIRQCVKNKYIVSVGDSTGFRMIRSIEDKMDFASFRKMSLKMLKSESSTSARVLEEFLNPDNELSIRELCRKFGLGCHGITYMIDKFRKQISKYYSKEDIFG